MEPRMERYLTTHYDEEINELLNNPDELLHVSVGVRFVAWRGDSMTSL